MKTIPIDHEGELTRKPARSLASVLRSKSWINIKYPPVVQITNRVESGDKRHLIKPVEIINWSSDSLDKKRFTYLVCGKLSDKLDCSPCMNSNPRWISIHRSLTSPTGSLSCCTQYSSPNLNGRAMFLSSIWDSACRKVQRLSHRNMWRTVDHRETFWEFK